MEPINIFDLNYDVLHIIFEKLAFKDQVNLAYAHPNLGEVFRIYRGKQFRKFYCDRYPNKIWFALLSVCGPMVESLVSDKHQLYASLDKKLQILNCAAKHCKSLKNLSLAIIDRKHLDALNLRLSDFKNLNSIELDIDQCFKCDNDATTIQKFQELPNLRKLSLDNFTQEALKSLRQVTQVEELYIKSEFLHYLTLDIGYICATLKNLRVLVYDGSIKDEDSFKALPQFCPELETLRLQREICSLQIPYFPKLKRFSVFYTSLIHRSLDYILGGFGQVYTKQLNELQIYGQNPELYEKDALLNQCLAIKKFEIIYNDIWKYI